MDFPNFKEIGSELMEKLAKSCNPCCSFLMWVWIYTVEPALSIHSFEQPTSYGRPLGHSTKWHFVYKWTSYEQPPALKGHFPVSQWWLLISGSTIVCLAARGRGASCWKSKGVYDGVFRVRGQKYLKVVALLQFLSGAPLYNFGSQKFVPNMAYVILSIHYC